MTMRPPAVAGMFYPDTASTLRADVRRMLDAPRVSEAVDRRVPKSLIVPHAGFVYSGPVAASAYRLLADAANEVSRVVVLGPAHRVYLRGMAVPTVESFRTPLGTVPVDVWAVKALEVFPWVVSSDEAHAQEHSIEVQLPFLQSVLTDFSLIPLVVGDCTCDQVSDVIETLWGDRETLIIVSSDLSHYLPYTQSNEVDADTTSQIVARAENLHGEQACGARAINGLMRVARNKGLDVEVLDVRNSGDTAGDKSQVVGYGAYAIY